MNLTTFLDATSSVLTTAGLISASLLLVGFLASLLGGRR